MPEDLPSLFPESPAAERGILSSFLQNSEKVYPICVAQGAQPEWFSEQDRSTLFSVFMDMGRAGVKADFVTTVTWIIEHKVRFETPVPDAFVAEIAGFTPTWTNVSEYLGIVKRCAARKLAILACQSTEKKLREDAASLQDVHDCLTGAFTGVSEILVEEEPEDNRDKEEILAFMDRMQEIVEGKGNSGMMPFGLPDIDDETGGAQRGELVVVHGATSTGKSLLSKLFTQKAAFERNERVAVFSLEMLHEQCLRRYVADLGNISLQSMRRGIFSKGEFARFSATMARISQAPLHIYDVRRNEMTPQSIEREVRKLKKNKGLDMVMLDYCQLVRLKSNSEKRRDQELQGISTRFKLLSQELNFAMIMVAQANENGTCFDSSQVESDADWVFNMMPVYKNDGKIRRIIGTDGLWVSKAREGQRGRKIPLLMEGKYARIGPPPPQAVRASDTDF